MTALRYRRNIDCLTANQLHDLRETVTTLYDLPPENRESFAAIAGLHGLPSPSYCIHGYPGFLTWHRAYMDAFDKALRCIKSKVTLPFWDRSSGPSTGVPAACSDPTYVNRTGNTVPNPLYSGPIAPAAGGGQTARRPDIDTISFDDLATQAQNAMSNTSLSSFQSSLNGPHGGVHGRVGGQMGTISRASYDPIFYLHHANVDRLWAKWQQANPGPLPSNEASLELDPFYKPYSTDLRTGDEFESTEALGYRYSNFCYFFPRIVVFKDLFKIEIHPEIIRRFTNKARLVLKTDKMQAASMELRAFINEPEVSAKTPTLGNPNFAGSFGLFGMGKDKVTVAKRREQRFDTEIDVTNAFGRVEADADKVTMTLAAVGIDGKPIPTEELALDGFEILVK